MSYQHFSVIRSKDHHCVVDKIMTIQLVQQDSNVMVDFFDHDIIQGDPFLYLCCVTVSPGYGLVVGNCLVLYGVDDAGCHK